jgi:hypothetical protein
MLLAAVAVAKLISPVASPFALELIAVNPLRLDADTVCPAWLTISPQTRF